VVDSSQIAEMITFIQPPRRSRGFPSSSEEGSFDVSFFYATWYYLNKRKSGDSTFNFFDYFSAEFNKRGVAFFVANKRGVELSDQLPLFEQNFLIKISRSDYLNLAVSFKARGVKM
jgi:hypothetical protein